MPLRYVIDAYNIINHIKFTSIHKKIRDPRKALLEFLRQRRLGKKSANNVVLVFDGYSNAGGANLGEPGIDVIYSGEESADTRIKRMVEFSKNPKEIAVVSDDREIQFFIRSVGAISIGVEEFMGIGAGEKPNRQEKDLIKNELNYSQMNKINQELRDLWLK